MTERNLRAVEGNRIVVWRMEGVVGVSTAAEIQILVLIYFTTFVLEIKR